MSFMFTSSSYGVAFLCAVIAVWLAKKKGFWSIAGAALLLCFTLSIYQAYITVAASFLLVLVISMLLRDDTEIKDILKKGLRYLLVIISAVGLYFLITFIILNVSKTFFNSYAVAQISHSRGITTGLVVVYKKFASYFVKGDVGLINTDLSKSMHFVSCVMAFAAIVAVQIKQKNAAKAILTWFLIALMPLSINFFSITNSFVHTLMLYSFVSVYILAIVAINAAPKDNARLGKEVICIALALIAANNIYIANRSYLQLNITYENAYSFYTSLAAEIKMTPGFEEGTKVAIIGENDNLLYNCADFADSDIFGIERSVINAINRETFIKYYVGFNAEFAGYELQEQIKQSQEFAAMPVYPYYGSVQKIGDCIVVKLS